MTRRTLQFLLVACVSSIGAMGQINCSPGSAAATKLVCQIPFSTGVFANNSSAGATGTALRNATAFNSAIATQVSQLPLASSSSGVVIVYKAGVPETYNNLGPILTDRAQTVGRHKLFLGASVSQFVFTSIDGISLKSVPFTYEATATDPTTGAVLSNTYTAEFTNIHFTLDQLVAVATFGLTNRIDLSVIVPYERVSIGAETFNSEAYILNANNVLVLGPYSIASTYIPGWAKGFGDVTVNAKGELWHGEHTTFATGLNVRTPTGDELNYLGSGAWGVNPYVTVSYLRKISPHAKIGYQWNTSTELNNPTLTAGGNEDLPGGFQYDVGADWAWLRHVTVAGDLLGSQYLNAPTLVLGTTPLPTPLTNPPTPSTVNLPTVTTANSSYTINDVSGGLKWNPYRDLVFSGNALYQLDHNGLRSRIVPLVGVSYKF
ncbi:MAG: hypothetical protein WAM66_10275 [Acidobacteriaceae bacterium]